MKVILRNDIDALLENCVTAIRTCWDSFDRQDSWWDGNGFNLGPNDKQLVQTIINNGHTSTLEHLIFTFDVKGITRAMLQELARQRIASLSVRSTRYTLKRSLSEPIENLIVKTGDADVDAIITETMTAIQTLYKRRPDINKDVIKYAITEALKVDLIYTINARSLRNLFNLRTSIAALPEFRMFCKAIWGVLPEQVRFIFQDVYHIQGRE